MKSRAALLASLLCLSLSAPARAAEEARVLVLPFQVNGGQDLAYLRVGVRDILASRLHREGEVAVVSQYDAAEADAALGAGRADLERLRILGRSASADYVVYGSVTAIGKGYSLDVQVLSASGGKPPWRDFSDGSSLDKLIPALGPMGEEIANRIAREHERAAKKGAAPSPPAPAEQESAAPAASAVAAAPAPPADVPNPSFAAPEASAQAAGALEPGVWRSAPVSHAVVSFAVADVDLDGAADVVAVDRTSVIVLGREGGKLAVRARVPGPSYATNLRVDVTDVNGNRVPDLVVASVARGRARSFVLERGESGFLPIVEDAPFLLARVAGAGLVGQALGAVDPLGRRVVRMAWKDGALAPGEPVSLPEGVGVFDFALVPFAAEGPGRTAAFSKESDLRLYGAGEEADEVAWESADAYDGTLNAFTASSKGSEILGGGGTGERTVYVSGRILPTDLDADGEPELLVRRNEARLGNFFERIRLFEGGRVHSLAWSGAGFEERWATPFLDGYVSDFALGDLDGDGREELVVAAVKDAGVVGEVRDLFAFGSEERGAKTVFFSYDLARPGARGAETAALEKTAASR